MPQDLFTEYNISPETKSTEQVSSAMQQQTGGRDLFAEHGIEAATSPGLEQTQKQPDTFSEKASQLGEKFGPEAIATMVPGGEGMLMKGAAHAIGGAGVGTIQHLLDMGYGLADLGKQGINGLTKKLFKKEFNPALLADKANAYIGPWEKFKGTPSAKFGEKFIGPMAGLVGGGEAAAAPMIAKGLGRILPKVLGYGSVGYATTPGGQKKRVIHGLLSGISGGLTGMLESLPYVFKGGLASKIEKVFEQQKNISKDLYKAVFKGTEKIKPEISNGVNDALQEASGSWATKSNPVTRAVKTYAKDENIESLHRLRSDLAKMENKFADKAMKNGLSGEDLNKIESISNAREAISKDLENNLSKIGKDTYDKYLSAQTHYKNNVVPFRHYPSLRKLLGKDREVATTLYRDLTKDAEGAKKIRGLLKTNLGSLQLARLLHHKVLGLPLPAYLTLGGGYGLYHLKNLGHK